MANKIILKKSSVAAKVPLPGDLEVGELAVNLADALLYTKDSGGSVITVGGGGGSLPSQSGNAGKYLTTDGTNAAWSALPTYLAVLTHSGTTVQVNAAYGYISVLTNGGSTVDVPIF